jgi:hypothetical protein
LNVAGDDGLNVAGDDGLNVAEDNGLDVAEDSSVGNALCRRVECSGAESSLAYYWVFGVKNNKG